MLMTSLLIVSGVLAAPNSLALENAMSARILGAWTVQIGPGSVDTPSGKVVLDEAHYFSIVPPETIAIEGERHINVPIYNPKAGGWLKGYRLKKLITIECSATDALLPDTLTLYAKNQEENACD